MISDRAPPVSVIISGCNPMKLWMLICIISVISVILCDISRVREINLHMGLHIYGKYGISIGLLNSVYLTVYIYFYSGANRKIYRSMDLVLLTVAKVRK